MTTPDDPVRAIRLIIAEDHAVVREGTRQLLEREDDIDVVGEAATGAEAVSLVAALAPDLVLMDIAMPVMNGIEATRQIKAARPSTAVLVLTAYDDDHYVTALLGAGAAGYLLKDVPAAELVHAIRAVYAGEAVLHPAIVRRVLARLADGEGTSGHGAPGGRDQALLTAREMEVLRLAASGKTNGQIAELLDFSVRTVQVHMTHVFGKLGVGSRTEAVVAGLRKGFISLDDLGEE